MEDLNEFKAKTIDTNRPAYELLMEISSVLDQVIYRQRSHREVADLATDLLFILAYKAFCGVYLLAVRGYEQDSATILRRLLEISAQMLYIGCTDDLNEQNVRADRYLQHDPDGETRWWWGKTGFKKLFILVGRSDTYEQDYRLLAQIAHGSARRNLPPVIDGKVQICTNDSFTTLIVFSCLYILANLMLWNRRFRFCDETQLLDLSTRANELRDRLISYHQGAV
jgi:hypothetical protein